MTEAVQAEFLRTAAAHADAVDRDGRFPVETLAAWRAAGLMSAMVPVDYGGSGASLADMARICNLLARVCASSAMIFAMHQIQVACLLDHGLHDAWHQQFARDLVTHQFLLASMTSEVGPGGNLRASSCAVTPQGDRFNLLKMTPTMSYGAVADAYFVTARRTPESPPSDQVLVTILRKDAMVEQTGVWDGLGLRGTGSGAFTVEASLVQAQVFSTAFADITAQTMLPVSHLLWASVWLGIAGGAAEKARAYLREQAKRNPGAPPPGTSRLPLVVGPLQLLQARLRVLLDRYESHANEHGVIAMETDLNGLKLDGSRICLDVVQQALMICGMAGYRNEGHYSLGRTLRDMWSAPLMIGNDRVSANTGAMLLAQRAQLGAIL